MVTLGMLLGKLLDGNPSIVVMPTKKLEAGVSVDVTGIKMAKTKDGTNQPVMVLTI